MDFSVVVSVLGVMLGGAITYFVERHFRLKDRRLLKNLRLNRLTRTFARAANDILRLNRQVLSEVPENHTAEFWPFILPMSSVGNLPALAFEAEDLAEMPSPNFDQLSYAITDLVEFRNSFLDVIRDYNLKRNELQRELRPYTALLPNGEFITDRRYKQVPAIRIVEEEAEGLARYLATELPLQAARVGRVVPIFNHKVSLLIGNKVRQIIQLRRAG